MTSQQRHYNVILFAGIALTGQNRGLAESFCGTKIAKHYNKNTYWALQSVHGVPKSVIQEDNANICADCEIILGDVYTCPLNVM